MNLLPLVTVILLPIGANFSGVPSQCGTQYDGMYYPQRKVIEHCAATPYREEEILAHETGHYVWFELLTDLERSAYKDLWKKSGSGTFYSKYSKTTEVEGFAEDFMYIHKGYSFRPGGFKRLNMVRKIYKKYNP